MNTIKLKGTFVIADRNTLICRALKEILAGYGAKVCATHEKEGLQMLLRKHRVTLVIADHPLLFKDSMDELQKMIGDHPDTSHLVLTSDISKAIFKELSQAGVRNIALKTDDQREIVLGVQAALAGRNHYSRDVLDLLLRSDGQTPDGLLLTPTESEIVPLICGGLSVKDIAERKQVGVRSVMAHRKSIYRKLGVTNAIELKRFAIRAGLIDNIEYHI